MFQLAEGNYAADLEGIEEGYSKQKENGFWSLRINVSAEHIDGLFRLLCRQVGFPAFLLFELGTNQKEEEKLRTSDQDPFHKDVFYLDGLNDHKFEVIYGKYRELLVHDGEICFGFGSHNGTDEVYVGAYKIFTVFTDSPEKYERILQESGFQVLENMKTVWDVLNRENPGSRRCVKKNGTDIYEMIEELKKEGLYLAERREE